MQRVTIVVLLRQTQWVHKTVASNIFCSNFNENRKIKAHSNNTYNHWSLTSNKNNLKPKTRNERKMLWKHIEQLKGNIKQYSAQKCVCRSSLRCKRLHFFKTFAKCFIKIHYGDILSVFACLLAYLTTSGGERFKLVGVTKLLGNRMIPLPYIMLLHQVRKEFIHSKSRKRAICILHRPDFQFTSVWSQKANLL